MARRRDARRLAVQILYQADVARRDPAAILAERRQLGQRIPGFTEQLVRGVAERLPELDRLIGEHAQDWTVARMAVIDRAILRVACYELLYLEDVPAAATIDEAVTTAKEMSTKESGGFVNGILGRIARDLAGTA
ncbi:MAG: transcription antitermination factor NusB [Actinomycetota bacterium]